MQVDTEQVERASMRADGKASNTANFNDSPNHVGVIKSMQTDERGVHQDADSTGSLVNAAPKGGGFTAKLGIICGNVTERAMCFLQTNKIAVLKQVDHRVVLLRANGRVKMEERVAIPRRDGNGGAAGAQGQGGHGGGGGAGVKRAGGGRRGRRTRNRGSRQSRQRAEGGRKEGRARRETVGGGRGKRAGGRGGEGGGGGDREACKTLNNAR